MYIVVNIGCIECGVSSGIVGVFSSLDTATLICEQLESKASWREGGQNSYEVFEQPLTNIINPEYQKYLDKQ